MLTRLTHLGTERHSTGIAVLSFRPDRPLRFTAGQFGLWLVGGAARPFTIASAPSEDTVQLATDLSSGSAIKRRLDALEPGQHVRLLGPIGRIAPPEDGRSVVFLSQGIGITPARALLGEPSARRRTLLHVGRPHFRSELTDRVDDARFVDASSAFTAELADIVARHDDAHFVIAGSRSFVGATSRQLTAHGVPPRRQRKDAFLGLKDVVARG